MHQPLQSRWRVACCLSIFSSVLLAAAPVHAMMQDGGGGSGPLTIPGIGQTRQSVVDNVNSGQAITFSAGTVEGAGMPSGVQNVDLSAHGLRRIIDSNSADKVFIPFATDSELLQFGSSNKAGEFYFDFFREADVVSVDFSGGVSNATLIDTAPAQTLTRDVNVPGGRLDTRSNATFDSTRVLRFNNVTLNMERDDCRKPQALGGGIRNDLPANICQRHNWTETPNLVLTYRPTVRHQGADRENPARAALAGYGRDFTSYIASHEWDVSFDAATGVVPPVQAPPIGEPCPPTAHNNRTWLALSNNNTQIVTGAAAGAAPNNCNHGVESARRTWDEQQDAICFDSQYYRQAATREVNVRWSNVVCKPNPDCGPGRAAAPNGVCVPVSARQVGMSGQGEHFSHFPGGTIQSVEGNALYNCARNGLSKLHDFSGWYGGRKKPGKGCGKADSDHRNFAFNGNKNVAASVLNLGNYSVNWSAGSDTNCLGWMALALCSGPNYAVPSLQMLAQNVTDPAQATPPAGMSECPADLNLTSGTAVFNNTTYFANATSNPGSLGDHQLRTANSFDAGAYPVTVLANRGFNCYQRTSYTAPQYDYNAPQSQWTTTQECIDIGYWGGYYCYDVATPPVIGNTTYYTLYTLTTALHCGEEQVTVATGRRVQNCNNTGRDGNEYATYTASVGGQCGVDSAASYSCVADAPPNPCDEDPWLCQSDCGGYRCFENPFGQMYY